MGVKSSPSVPRGGMLEAGRKGCACPEGDPYQARGASETTAWMNVTVRMKDKNSKVVRRGGETVVCGVEEGGKGDEERAAEQQQAAKRRLPDEWTPGAPQPAVAVAHLLAQFLPSSSACASQCMHGSGHCERHWTFTLWMTIIALHVPERAARNLPRCWAFREAFRRGITTSSIRRCESACWTLALDCLWTSRGVGVGRTSILRGAPSRYSFVIDGSEGGSKCCRHTKPLPLPHDSDC